MSSTNVRQAGSGPSSPGQLALEWFTAYERECLSEDGDPDAFVSDVRDLAEAAGPGTATHQAFGLLLERLRAEDMDAPPDDDQ